MKIIWKWIKSFLRFILGDESKEKAAYRYTKKDFLVTYSEAEFFGMLEHAVGGKYMIFPQVHLSALFNHKIKGQSWKGAFSHINGKSVDYIICEKEHLRPVLAVELDDKSHEAESRRLRDDEIERIFREANLPLLRFKKYKNLTAEEISQRISHVLES